LLRHSVAAALLLVATPALAADDPVVVEQLYDLCMANRDFAAPREPATDSPPFLWSECRELVGRYWAITDGVKQHSRVRSVNPTAEHERVRQYLADHPK
jgi:hypothetical protein